MPRRACLAALTVVLAAGLSACSPEPAAPSNPNEATPDVSAATTLPAASSSTSPSTSPSATLASGPARIATLKVAEAASGASSVQADHKITEIIPPVTDPDDLPVIYLLHGLPGQSTDLCSSGVAADLMARFRAGQRPFLLACPDGNPSANDDSEWADSADGRDRLETFVTSTAIAAVEGSHPRPKSERAIGGFSMGGFGAAAIALRHPELYAQVVTLAGYFHLDDPSTVFGANPVQQSAHDPSALVGQATSMRWYLAEAAGDSEELSAHDSERFAVLLAGVGAAHQLSVTAGGHDLTWARAAFIGSVAFLDAGWPSPN